MPNNLGSPTALGRKKRKMKAYTIADKAKFLEIYNQQRASNPFIKLAPIAKLCGMKLSTAMSILKHQVEIMTHAYVNLTRFRELGEAAMRGEAKEDTMAHYFALMRSLEAFVERYDLETADDG